MWLQDTHGKQTRVQREGMEKDTHTNQAGTDSTHSDMTDCRTGTSSGRQQSTPWQGRGQFSTKTYDSTASKYMRQQYKSVETGPRAPTVKTSPPPGSRTDPTGQEVVGERGVHEKNTPARDRAWFPDTDRMFHSMAGGEFFSCPTRA